MVTNEISAPYFLQSSARYVHSSSLTGTVDNIFIVLILI